MANFNLMKISPFAVEKITPPIVGSKTGKQLVMLFNDHGFRDVYDEIGLPDIGKRNGQRPSKTEYVKKRLLELSGKPELRDLLIETLRENNSFTDEFNKILLPEGYTIDKFDDNYIIHGGVVDNRKPVVNQAHFENIQNQILKALNDAKVSIRVVMAWFTNEKLFNKLLEKHSEGLDVQVAIYDDGVNKKHGVDVTQLPYKLIKRGQRGGLMHDKFCVIDNQVVITGSYNWTDNAEFRNDENITVEKDPDQATKFSVEYRRLTT